MSVTQFYPYIQKFIEIFQISPNVIWSFQVRDPAEKDIKFWDQKRLLTNGDWLDHFSQKAICIDKRKKIYRSAIALRLTSLTSDDVRVFVLDCDNSAAVAAVWDKIIPELDRRGVDWIWETSGIDGDRGHLFVRTECKLKIQKLWAESLFAAVGLDPRDRKFKFELYPAFKPENIIRPPGALHLRNNNCNECLFKDRSSSDPLEIMKMFAEARPLSEAEMLLTISTDERNAKRAELAPVRRALSLRRTFYYSPLHLPVPDDLPPLIKTVAGSCPAVNRLINAIATDNFANDGNEKHQAILSLSGLAMYNDMVHKGRYGDSGMEWFEKYIQRYRSEPFDSHHWIAEKEQFEGSPQRILTSCKTWDRVLGWCEGCRWKNRVGFERPTQLYWGKQIKRENMRALKLVTHDQIRKTTFVQVRDRLRQLLTSGRYERKAILVCSPQGSGKCHKKDTPVLMHDGTTKFVQDVAVNDLLMGPDSLPRRVVSLARGQDQMFEIRPKKGESFTVNAAHILSLKFSGNDYGLKTGDIVNLPVQEFLQKNKDFKFRSMLWRSPVEFEPKPVLIDPWMLGYWLGDGDSSKPEITTIDSEVVNAASLCAEASGLSLYAKQDGRNCHYSLRQEIRRKDSNRFTVNLKHYELLKNKHVPQQYKSNSREVRLQLLAGLIDSDGSLSGGGYDWINKNKQLAEDFVWLCRSVGLAAYLTPCEKSCKRPDGIMFTGTYYRVSVSGDCSIIPCRVKRKQASERRQKKNVLVTNFEILDAGYGEYFGFEVDGPDRLYLLGDFTVTHNSVLIDQASVEIARMTEVSAAAVEQAINGKKILISVPTADLAIEHKKRIDAIGWQFGIKAFINASHERLMDKFVPALQPTFPGCPEAGNIKKHRDLGIGSMVYKDKYCNSCPLLETCPFPNQYSQNQDDKYQIVIVQHAHFTSPEAMESILKKHFDVMFVDEAIVDALISQVKARQIEWELLDALKSEFPWTEDVARWMRDGGYPAGKKIYPKLEEMEEVYKFFRAHEADWRIPMFLRYYNLEYLMDSELGLWVFSPLPTDRIPLLVITDATPPLEIYQYMLDDKDIEVFGADEILDYRKMNPKNKVIQVLDASMSKTSLRGPADDDGEYEYVRFFEILDFIMDKARGEYKDKKILITVYGGEFWRVAEEYILRNYADVGYGDRVILGKMSIGTNKFESCDVQFLVAGVYLSARDAHMHAFKLRVMANYWNRLKGRPILPNYYPYGVGDQASIERIDEPVYRIEPVGSGHCYLFEYPEFKYFRPVETFHWLAERYMIAKTQQALRLRYNDDKEKITYIFGKYFMPSFLITDSVLEEDLLGYLRISDQE